MTENLDDLTAAAHLCRENYELGSLAAELRVNQLCNQLLSEFHQHLLHDCKLDPLEASALAVGAKYFLLDFLIDHQQLNIFAANNLHAKRFAGHWYIISNLEPNIEELQDMLSGTAAFYRYCAELKLISDKTSEQISATCAEIDYYNQRIETFLDITGDGYFAWSQECPLK